jgi:hypothetical protein
MYLKNIRTINRMCIAMEISLIVASKLAQHNKLTWRTPQPNPILGSGFKLDQEELDLI